MEDIDRRIINRLQDGFSVCARPFATVAGELGVSERELIDRVRNLLVTGTLARLGPLYNAESLGEGCSLCAMKVAEADTGRVMAIVNGFPEVARHDARDHDLNLWFVLAAADPQRIEEVIRAIESATGYGVRRFPRIEEFRTELRLRA